jgi:hypothetical protein
VQVQNEDIYYHRTAKGLGEIRHKSHGLSQSERLVLIIIDGITPLSGLRDKLKGLAEGRFESAIFSLLSKGLVAEGIAPQSDQSMEFLNSNLIAGFLHQDPLDPVTIAAPVRVEQGHAMSVTPPSDEPVPRPSRITKVDFYIPLEPVIRPRNIEAPDAERKPRPIFNRTAESGRASAEKGTARNMLLQPAWLVFAGLLLLILIIVFEAVH